MTSSSFFEASVPQNNPMKKSLMELSTPPKPPQAFLQTTTTNNESTFETGNTKELMSLRIELKSRQK